MSKKSSSLCPFLLTLLEIFISLIILGGLKFSTLDCLLCIKHCSRPLVVNILKTLNEKHWILSPGGDSLTWTCVSHRWFHWFIITWHNTLVSFFSSWNLHKIFFFMFSPLAISPSPTKHLRSPSQWKGDVVLLLGPFLQAYISFVHEGLDGVWCLLKPIVSLLPSQKIGSQWLWFIFLLSTDMQTCNCRQRERHV